MADKLVLILNVEENSFNSDKLEEPPIYPMILLIDWDGFYKTHINKIEKLLDIDSRAEIMQLVYFNPNITPTEIKRVTGYAYSLIQRNLKNMKELKLIKPNIEQGKLGYEAKLTIPPEIKIFRYSEYLAEKDKILKMFKKQEFKEIKKIEEDYREKIERALRKPKK